MRHLLLLAVLAGCPKPAATPQVTAERHPRLVVLIVIDQLPSWVFDKQQELFIGGIGRLMRDGAYIKDGELPFANTLTAPGHAALATGAAPRTTGIVGNQWWRRGEQRERPAEYDPDAGLFVVGGAQGNDPLTADLGASGKALRVDGIADVLRAATGGRGHSISIALKARAACLMAGKKPDLAIWYEPAAGGMTTSRAYAASPPKWLFELASTHPASKFFGATWDARVPAMLARTTKIPDDAPGEADEHRLGLVFPHRLSKSDAPERAVGLTPFGDDLVMTTVAAALDSAELGKDDVPDFLAISFNAHDLASHAWGPESWEVLDLTLRLDAALGQLFEALDAHVGKGQWAVVLTSDHGATPIPERGRIPKSRRIAPKEIEAAAETALERELGRGSWVSRLSSDNLYLAPALAQTPDDLRAKALAGAATAIAQLPNIAAAGRTDRLTGDCSAYKDLERAICLSVVDGEAGELYAFPAEGSMITDSPAGSHHDAPFDDNRHVPILVMAPGLEPQNGTGSLLQVAPTLAALLGIPPPPAAKEPPLFKIKP